MAKKYAPPVPDGSLHRPGDIEYARELVAAAGISQRKAAMALGLDERAMRYRLNTPERGKRATPLTYAEQYALEVLADAKNANSVHESAAQYGSERTRDRTVWFAASTRPLTDSDAGKVVVGKDRFGASVVGTLERDSFGLVVREWHPQPVDVHSVPVDRVAIYTLLDPPEKESV